MTSCSKDDTRNIHTQDSDKKCSVFFVSYFLYTRYTFYMALIGEDSGYSQSKEGILTGFIKKHPNGVVILEELEKAHTAVIRSINDILCEGKMRDSYTQLSLLLRMPDVRAFLTIEGRTSRVFQIRKS